MKKIILISFLTIGFNLQAQEFNFRTEKIQGVAEVGIINGASVIIEKEGTQKELYDSVLSWAKENFINPEEVLVAKTENEFIKIKEISDAGVGTIFYYTLTFKFKENKFKIQINSTAEAIAYKNKNGKKYKWQTFDSICSKLNNIALSVKEYSYNDF